jgi:hypothetical protein
MLRNGNATLSSEKKISLPGGHHGREILANLNDKKGQIRARVYLVGSRMYQVMVMGIPGFVSAPDADTFLSSFELKK